MYRFARSPRWVAGHALAGVLLVVFVVAGVWQYGRHGETRERNAATLERQDAEPLDVGGFFAAVQDADALGGLEYRSVTLPVAGVNWDERVLIRNRSLNGLAGCHLAMPVAVARGGDASGVLVVAGWLRQQACESLHDVENGDAAVTRRAVPSQIAGRIRLSQTRGLLGPTDPAQGRLATLARTDVERIDQQTALDLAPVYIEATDTTNAASAFGADGELGFVEPVPLPPPELDAGPHLGYTVQWFSFALVAVVGYALVLRHQARKGESEQIADN
ncbi:SURF1 family protein [Candidatus Poriferisodalis sp.]|uniref:SURF1 family protein n=1 Tax=Candidatus Poriferisodalis sp. TaxID=3101277 RepID=UPI003B0266E0